MSARIYRCFRAILRAAVRVFFRQIEVVGLEHVPDSGPVIFAGNHPNSMIDPVLIVTSCGRIVRFAAKDVLFRSPLLRPLMNAIGAVPIARRVDHADAAEASQRNQSSFDTLIGVLSEGGAIGIFPEGLSHDGPQLARLKTGAARIALGVVERDAAARVTVVPCGLTYMQRKRFRSRVLLQFGPPLVVGAERGAAPDAVAAITADLDRSLRALTVNASDWDTLRVLDGIRRLYQPPAISIEQRVELARRFSGEYPRVRDDPEVRALYARVEAYLDRLRDGGLTDRDLQRDWRPLEAIERVARHLSLLLVWLPLALPGAILHAPAGILVRLAAPLLTPRKDVLGATKFLAGLLTVLASYAAGIVWVGWRFRARPALVTLVALPVTGYATIQVFDRGASLRRGLTTLVRLVTLRRELAALRAERAALEDSVVHAVDRLRPPEMVPLFPRTPRSVPTRAPSAAGVAGWAVRLEVPEGDVTAGPSTAVAGARPTVVLLHGLARTRHSMAALARYLERAGYPTWSRSYPSRRRSIAGAADEIAGWLARDLPAGRPLAAVTHSLGGVIIRHLAARVPFQQIVMLAPPNRGSRVSRALYRSGIYRWFFGPAGQELAEPDGARGWPPLTVPFAVIAGTRGRALANPTSWLTGARGYFASGQAHDGTLAVDETALDGMVAFATVDASHTWIMNDARVHRLVLEFLETRAFAVGAPARDMPG